MVAKAKFIVTFCGVRCSEPACQNPGFAEVGFGETDHVSFIWYFAKLTQAPQQGKFQRPRSQELLTKYIEQYAKQEPSSQFADRAGSGLQAFTSSRELCGRSARAQMRV